MQTKLQKLILVWTYQLNDKIKNKKDLKHVMFLCVYTTFVWERYIKKKIKKRIITV